MTPQDQQQQNIQSVGGDTVREQDKIQLVLAYLGLLSLIPLLTVKDSEFVKWHAKQGLVLFIGLVIVNFLQVIPFIGQLVGCVAFIGYVVAVIMGVTKALKGERFPIPLVSDLASKF
ncbi:MAG: DUF4870 domain-containing protein [Archangium sp.]|nr:DUF4870 domain-containing protein [Archangium sp.]MDP3155137.1 DUF4870 domain-containing protein [Archangium sp.]MDP3573352.1 DUF4870 domain-containing protein [Archangium sp.]